VKRALLALDLHAHVDLAISPTAMRELGAVVFAATRSLSEAQTALERSDALTVWGVGCHPGLVKAHREFDASRFAELLQATAFVSEIGLDRSSRVPMGVQQATLSAILAELQRTPRIASIHSYDATDLVLAALKSQPIRGCVLHWWLGDMQQTREAVDLGCFFSVNASSVRREDVLAEIPFERLLTETDHPFGDRWNKSFARPGFVGPVERELGMHYGKDPGDVRPAIWDSFARLAAGARVTGLLPRAVRLQLVAR
jgi:TatD DNase family protein